MLGASIDNKAGFDQGTYGGGHSWCNVSALTAAKLARNSEDTATSHGPSIDFVIAQRLAKRFGGRATPFHLMIEGHRYGSPYFRSPQQRQYGETNPRKAFASPFAGVTSSGEPDPAIVRAWDMMHVANLEIADILTPWAPSGLQVDSGYGIGHSLHHMATDVGPKGPSAAEADAWALEMKENRQWRLGLVKRLLDGLSDPSFMEGDKTMLDNSLVYYTSEFSRGVAHNARDTLCLLAGSAGGYFKTGRYLNFNTKWTQNPNTLDYETTASTNNLFTSFLNAFGESDTTFGAMEHSYRTGPLTELR